MVRETLHCYCIGEVNLGNQVPHQTNLLSNDHEFQRTIEWLFPQKFRVMSRISSHGTSSLIKATVQSTSPKAGISVETANKKYNACGRGCTRKILTDEIKIYVINKEIVEPIRSNLYSPGLLPQWLKWLICLKTRQSETLPARAWEKWMSTPTEQGNGQVQSLHMLRCSNSGDPAPSFNHKFWKGLILNSWWRSIELTSVVRNIKKLGSRPLFFYLFYTHSV